MPLLCDLPSRPGHSPRPLVPRPLPALPESPLTLWEGPWWRAPGPSLQTSPLDARFLPHPQASLWPVHQAAGAASRASVPARPPAALRPHPHRPCLAAAADPQVAQGPGGARRWGSVTVVPAEPGQIDGGGSAHTRYQRSDFFYFPTAFSRLQSPLHFTVPPPPHCPFPPSWLPPPSLRWFQSCFRGQHQQGRPHGRATTRGSCPALPGQS